MDNLSASTVAISVGTSIVTAILTLVAKDSWETSVKVRRMMLGLCIDCAGMVRAFTGHTAGLKEGVKMMRKKTQYSYLDEELQLLRKLPSGYVVSPPLSLSKELVNLLSADNARKVFYFYDSWERYAALEKDYREAFQSMLDAVAEAKFDTMAENRYKYVREERMEQLEWLARNLYQAIFDNMAYSCDIIDLSKDYLDGESTRSIPKLTHGQWKTWEEVRQSRKNFKSESRFKWDDGATGGAVSTHADATGSSPVTLLNSGQSSQ